ncbi:MAG: DNA alkylation repair protein [Clostridia bacterium]|nr:DNA alkylation repair protein [Clostridia bacterium]
MTVLQMLRERADTQYADFQAKLIPDIDRRQIIGVRTPDLKALAKEMNGTKQAENFLKNLPHRYFDENQLHIFLLNREKDFEKCLERIEAFLPYINNWATCDQLSPPVFGKNKTALAEKAFEWIDSGEIYTVRFGTGMLMRWFLDADFDIKYAKKVAKIRSDEYYINMMVAWYFATALAKQWDACIPFIEKGVLPVWVHNRAIQKSIESFRITPGQKDYLRTLRK